jgi:hypothetical protein
MERIVVYNVKTEISNARIKSFPSKIVLNIDNT